MKITKIRGFELVSKEEYEKTNATVAYENLTLPKRATIHAAGYDIKSTMEFTLNPGEDIVIPTGFKAYMQPGEMLGLYPRSGMGFKYQIQLANTVGIGDGDYYNCESNEGHYFIKLVNRGSKVWEVKEGDGIGQAIFQPILLADGDDFLTGETRKGGFGSTDKEEHSLDDICSKARNIGYDVHLNNLVLDNKLDFDGDALNVTKINNLKSDNVRQRIISNRARNMNITELYAPTKDNKLTPEKARLLALDYGCPSDKVDALICEMFDTPETSCIRKVTVPKGDRDFINNTTTNHITNVEDIELGMCVLVCDTYESQVLCIGDVIRINETSITVSTEPRINLYSARMYDLKDNNIKIFKYKGPFKATQYLDSSKEETLTALNKLSDEDIDVFINLRNEALKPDNAIKPKDSKLLSLCDEYLKYASLAKSMGIKIDKDALNSNIEVNYSKEVKDVLNNDNMKVLRDSNNVIYGFVKSDDNNVPEKVVSYLGSTVNSFMLVKDIYELGNYYTLEPNDFMFIDLSSVSNVAHSLKPTDNLKLTICGYGDGYLLLVCNISKDETFTFDCKDLGVNMPTSSLNVINTVRGKIVAVSDNYFKVDNLVKIDKEEIPNLKFGDLVAGVETYGYKLRFISGMVGEVRDNYINIMANDGYKGARGSDIEIDNYAVYKLSDEDILCDEFMNKVIKERAKGNA